MADKRIVLFCAGGMSTSLLVNKMRDAAAAAGKNYSPGKPIDGIDMRVYGMMDGKGAIAIARKLMND